MNYMLQMAQAEGHKKKLPQATPVNEDNGRRGGVSGKTAAAIRKRKVLAKDVLNESKNPMQAKEVADLIGCCRDTAWNTLRSMLLDGTVSKTRVSRNLTVWELSK